MNDAPARAVTFGVVVPAYQAAIELPGSLETVRAQTHRISELIVVDDGSTDGTSAVARASGAPVIRTAHAGVAAARNAGIAGSRADWIAFLDADDRWLPHYLDRVAAAIRACPDADAVFTDYAIADGRDYKPSAHSTERHLRGVPAQRVAPAIALYEPGRLVRAYVRSRTFALTSALAVRRDTLLRLGGYDSRLRVAEDFDLLLRLFAVSSVALVQEPLTIYRRHAGSLMDRFEVESFAWERQVWERSAAAADRYPVGLAAELAARWPLRLCEAGTCAMRFGRFDHARARFIEACRAGAPLGWLGLAAATLLDNRIGRGLHAFAKTCRHLRLWSRHEAY